WRHCHAAVSQCLPSSTPRTVPPQRDRPGWGTPKNHSEFRGLLLFQSVCSDISAATMTSWCLLLFLSLQSSSPEDRGWMWESSSPEPLRKTCIASGLVDMKN
ncbi:hypothetical protein J4Q44_G00347940, partial [Coregonus suidteri]